MFLGATVASERTAAAEGPVGDLRRDPFAMLPFCGYHMADYWAHWLRLGASLEARGVPLPAVFAVNWFRRDADGGFLWPGFGENSRVLAWAVQRLRDEVPGRRTAVGVLPAADELDLDGLELPAGALDRLLAVDADEWTAECERTGEFFEAFGDRVPGLLRAELEGLRARLRQESSGSAG